MRGSIAVSRSREDRQRCASVLAGSRGSKQAAASSGWLRQEPVTAAPGNAAARPTVSLSSTETANIGIRPTMERTFSGTASPSGVQACHSRSHPFVPQAERLAHCRVDRHFGDGGGDEQKCSKNLRRCPRRPGRSRQLERDAQHVESIDSHPGRAVGLLERPPLGSGCERSKTPMLSRPRKPPGKYCGLGVLRFTHQVKLSSSLWKTRSRKSWSRRARARGRSCKRARRPRRGRADSRRRRPTRRRAAGRSGACTTRGAGRAAPWRTSGSISARRRSGRPGPRRRTTGTPTCRASRARRR